MTLLPKVVINYTMTG